MHLITRRKVAGPHKYVHVGHTNAGVSNITKIKLK